MVRYEPYASGYLVWFPGSDRIEKARNIIFYEAVAPATPILYEEEGELKNMNDTLTSERETKTHHSAPSSSSCKADSQRIKGNPYTDGRDSPPPLF